jgi:hypothetical protein
MNGMRRALALAVVASLLTGCGGGAHSLSSLLPNGSSRSALDTTNPNDTLYVSNGGGVSAFPLTASGAASPTATFEVHPDQTGSIVGVETAASGSVEVLQSFQNTTAGINDCRVVEVPGNSNGSAVKTNQYDCATTGTGAPYRGRSIARGPNGEIDSLYTSTGVDEILRLTFPATTTVFPAAGSAKHNSMYEGAGGHMYVSSGSANDPIVIGASASTTGCSASATGAATVDNYSPGASTPAHTFTINGRSTAGVLAIAPDNTTLYVATCTTAANTAVPAGSLLLDEVTTQGANGAISAVGSIGPFGNQNITALAVDGQGNLYVGLSANDSSGTTNVRVYAPGAITAGNAPTKPTPIRILQNPVPVVSGAKIVALAVNQTIAPPTATPVPTATPTVAPTDTPTAAPTATPTVAPTATPTVAPTATPTVAPTATPTIAPTATPTVAPTATPTVKPTATPTPVPTATPTIAPTATPSPSPTPIPNAIGNGGFESPSLPAYGSAVSAGNWTQCTIPDANIPASGAPAVQGPGNTAPTPHPGTTFTPMPNTTPAAVIQSSGTSIQQGSSSPVPTTSSVVVHSGTYAAVFGQLFNNYNAGDYRYNGLCQQITVPSTGVLNFSVYGTGNEGSLYVDFDAILLNGDGTWNSWLYDESADNDTSYRNVSVPMPSGTYGNTYTLFIGMWTKSGSTSGATYYSGYYFLDDVSLYPNTAQGVASRRRAAANANRHR